MADAFPLPALWVGTLFRGFLEETAFRRIQRRGEMRQAVVDAVGGWRAERALAGTALAAVDPTDVVRVRPIPHLHKGNWRVE